MKNTLKRLSKETLKSLSSKVLLKNCVVKQLLFRSKYIMDHPWKILFKNLWMNQSLMTEMFDLFKRKNLRRLLNDYHSDRMMKMSSLLYTVSTQRLVINEWSQAKSISNGRTLFDRAQEILITAQISTDPTTEAGVKTLQKTESEWWQGLWHFLAFMT